MTRGWIVVEQQSGDRVVPLVICADAREADELAQELRRRGTDAATIEITRAE
jgi:hypothetical protein